MKTAPLETVRPIGSQVLVQVDRPEDKTPGGIVLPDQAKAREKPMRGKVLATGPGTLDDQLRRVPMEVKQGDTVLFARRGGHQALPSDKDKIFLREEEILAVVEG